MSKWEIETMMKAIRYAKQDIFRCVQTEGKLDLMEDYDDFVKMYERLEDGLSAVNDEEIF